MKARSMMITAAVLTLLCASGREGPAIDDAVPLQPTKDDSAERTAAVQNRIAGTFYSNSSLGRTARGITL
jgi:hypothetical protein